MPGRLFHLLNHFRLLWKFKKLGAVPGERFLGTCLWGSFVVSSFCLQSFVSLSSPSLLLMHGLGCEMQSKSDTAHSPLPDHTSPSCLEGQAHAIQGSPVSSSWHGVGGWGGVG